MLFNYGTRGKTTAGSDHAFWARVRIKDLRYSQDSCSELFSRSAELDSFESRKIQKLREQLSDDPDEVLSTLRIWPEVVLHSDRVFSMNNRRLFCIKNCAAPRDCRVWVKLYHSPDDYDQVYGRGAFDKYYTTTCSGEHITVTEHRHKGNLARTFGVDKVCEAHITLSHRKSVNEVCADRAHILKDFNLFDIQQRGDNQIVVHGALQRDVDRAGAYIQGKYDRTEPLPKRSCDESRRMQDGNSRCPSPFSGHGPTSHNASMASGDEYIPRVASMGSSLHHVNSFHIGSVKAPTKYSYVHTGRVRNGFPEYEDEAQGLVVFIEDGYWYASGRTGLQHRFRTKEDPRSDGLHLWEQRTKNGWVEFGKWLSTRTSAHAESLS